MALSHRVGRRRRRESAARHGAGPGALRRYWRSLIVLTAGGLIAASIALVVGATTGGQRHAGTRAPNIVYVLTDDLSFDLLRYMPTVQAMQRRAA